MQPQPMETEMQESAAARGNDVLSRRATLRGLAALGATVAAAASAPKAWPRPRDDSWEVLEVGPGKHFKSLTLAGAYMNSIPRWNNGFTPAEQIERMRFRIIISPGPPGYYTNDSGSHSRRWTSMVGWPPYEGDLRGPVIIEGEAGKPPPMLDTDGYGDGVLYYQKGLFSTGDCDATFRRLAFKGFRRRDGNGNYSGLRLGDSYFKPRQPGQILVEDCEFAGCDNGIMGGRPGQAVTLRRCYFHDNGNGTGRVHNIYIGEVDTLLVEDVLSTRCEIGHLLKSRAAQTTIRRTRLVGGGGSESACLDVPDAGVLQMDGVVCEKSPHSDADWLIHYGGENQDQAGIPFHNPSSVTIRDLTLLAPEKLARGGRPQGFANQSGLGERFSGRGSHLVQVDARDVLVFGLNPRAAGLPCRPLGRRPNVSLSTPVAV
jgi:hypothetical protein